MDGEQAMTPQKQTIFSDLTTGVHGNCFTACVASLFDKPISEVPNFIDMGEDWFDAFIKYVHEQGAELIGMYHLGPKEWPDDSLWQEFDGYAIAGGGSPRGVPNGHAVIYKNGEPFFDPHPSNAFLTVVEEFYAIRKPKTVNT